MTYLNRKILGRITDILARQKSILLLGPRQSGKTTLLRELDADLNITFIQPRERLRYEADPSVLADEVMYIAKQKKTRPLVIVDEVQKIPLIMDVVQDLIDNNIAQFILTGSSARKLKKNRNLNLLPGRVIKLHMDPLTISELEKQDIPLTALILDGSLPEIILTADETEKEILLDSYVSLYLEEEIRAEAIIRNVSGFSRFLELAANESGLITNFQKLSQSIGVAHSTVAEYYQILEDCLIAERIDPLLQSKTRHRLSKKSKYIFFDMGLRRVAAKEGRRLSEKQMGHLFEQFIGLELIRATHFRPERISIKYWRDLNGPEVDFIIEHPDWLIPVEVKYTDNPTLSDVRHIRLFLSEYDKARIGYIICRTPNPRQISDNIIAISWRDLDKIFENA